MKFTDILVSKISIFSPEISKLFSKYGVYNTVVRVLKKVGYYKFLIKVLLRFGATPIVKAHMKDNTKILIDLRSSTEYNCLFSGEYDNDFLEVLHNLLDPNEYFLDVGANIGFYSISIGAKLGDKGSGKVISFEPFENNYKRLIENLKLNNLEDCCNAINIGLSDSSKTSLIVLREDFTNGSITGNASVSISDGMDSGFEKVPIRLQRLDDFWGKFKSKSEKIGLIKMDIEGHEDLCLEGGQKIIHEHRPTILLEINKPYYHARRVKLDDIFPPLIPENYAIYFYDKTKWKQIYTFDKCRTIDNVFLVPNERLLEDKYKVFSQYKSLLN